MEAPKLLSNPRNRETMVLPKMDIESKFEAHNEPIMELAILPI
jgi:hypothetical protein